MVEQYTTLICTIRMPMVEMNPLKDAFVKMEIKSNGFYVLTRSNKQMLTIPDDVQGIVSHRDSVSWLCASRLIHTTYGVPESVSLILKRSRDCLLYTKTETNCGLFIVNT